MALTCLITLIRSFLIINGKSLRNKEAILWQITLIRSFLIINGKSLRNKEVIRYSIRMTAHETVAFKLNTE